MKQNQLLVSLALCFFIWSCDHDRIELPQVHPFPNELHLTIAQPSAQLFLSTDPLFQITWKVTKHPDWLLVTPLEGDIITSPMLTVTANVAEMLAGSYHDYLIINTSTGSVSVSITIQIDQSIAIQTTPEHVLFGYSENSKTVTLTNNSNSTVSWQLNPSVTYLTTYPSSGTMAKGQFVSVTVDVNRATLSSQLYIAQLNLKINDKPNGSISIHVNNYAEDNLLLNGIIIDAEYNRKHDRLIAVTIDKLFKIDPDSRSVESISISQPVTCVGISPDGEHAVTGHNGSITLIDLGTMHMNETYNVSTHVMDIVFAPNHWVYAFPKTDQWEHIRCINLEDGTELLHTGNLIYAGTKAKLHPSGNFIYGANNGIIPNDVEKYNITTGQADYLYNSPYHGQYDFGGNLWIADDGTKMITLSRNVFNLTDNAETDMIYSGTLPGSDEWVQTADYIAVKNKIGVVYSNRNQYWEFIPQSSAHFFTANNYNYVEEKIFPELVVQTTNGFELVPALGYFGFFNSTGTKFHVLVTSGNKGITTQWALATVHIED